MTQRRPSPKHCVLFFPAQRGMETMSERDRGRRTLWIVEFKRTGRNIRLEVFSFSFFRRSFYFFSSVLRGQWDFIVGFTLYVHVYRYTYTKYKCIIIYYFYFIHNVSTLRWIAADDATTGVETKKKPYIYIIMYCLYYLYIVPIYY